MKTYVAYNVFAPELAKALGEPSHIIQIDIVVVAGEKRDVGPLLEDRGAVSIADTVARKCKVGQNTTLRTLREQGLIPEAQIGVYVLPNTGGQGNVVLRLNLDRTQSVIATRQRGPWRAARD